MLLNNGKVWAEGRNKHRHLVDNENESKFLELTYIAHENGVEIPFYEKKDKIISISTFCQVTIALTEKGKVFICGDKIAKIMSK